MLEGNRRPQVIFQGQTPAHAAFVLTADQARAMVERDPKSRAVLFPYLVGRDLNGTGEPSRFIIDFDTADAMTAEALAPEAYEHVKTRVLPKRQERAQEEAARNEELLKADPGRTVTWHQKNFLDQWWRLGWRRSNMVSAITALSRYIVLSRVSVWTRPSIYAFVSPEVRPSDALNVFAFEDDYSFGILNSSYHRSYFEERCSKMRVDLRYTSRTVFDTFPWPQAPSEEAVGLVTAAVKDLLDFRDERLADGITLEKQYSSLREPGKNPLRVLQEKLDDAVAIAYGFSPNDDVLAQLLALNQSIAVEERGGHHRAPAWQ